MALLAQVSRSAACWALFLVSLLVAILDVLTGLGVDVLCEDPQPEIQHSQLLRPSVPFLIRGDLGFLPGLQPTSALWTLCFFGF